MKPTLESILSAVARYYGLTIDEVKSKNRNKVFVKARQVYCYLAYLQTLKSTIKIGDFIGIDHATVIHGKEKIANEIKIYPDIESDINQLKYLTFSKCKMLIELDDFDLLQMSINYTKSFLPTT